jgi:signal transduction histidine kinase
MAMQGYLELLRLTADSAAPEKRLELIQRASKASDNLSYLLTSILDARRLDNEAKDFTPSAVNVRETLTASAQLLDPREGVAGERDLRLVIPPEFFVWGEPVRLQQIFTNLLSNAIKYSEPGSPIEVIAQINVTPYTRKGRHNRELQPLAEIRFRDYGLGVPPEQAPLLFQRFVRLQRDLASTTIGNGLGLYLCRILVEAMGGRIRVESDGIPGNGSTFILTLPTPPAKAFAPRLTKPDLTQIAAEV